jgi:hypothetical protein
VGAALFPISLIIHIIHVIRIDIIVFFIFSLSIGIGVIEGLILRPILFVPLTEFLFLGVLFVGFFFEFAKDLNHFLEY